MRARRCGICVALAVIGMVAPAAAQEDAIDPTDPLVEVTRALPGCPPAVVHRMDADEARAQAHSRSQRGTSCYLSGQCRLPNSYLYDREIVPRVQQFLRQDRRFADTSVWVLGQRRLVTLMGCVHSARQALDMEQAVILVDDVSGVINHLVVIDAPGLTEPRRTPP